MIKIMKRILASVLAVLMVFSLMPLLTANAAVTSLDINVDPELLRSLFVADEAGEDIRSQFDGKVSFNIDSVGELRFAAFDKFDISSNGWSSGVYMFYQLNDPSLIQLGSALRVNFNGVALAYRGYGGDLNLYCNLDDVDIYPDYSTLAPIVELIRDGDEYGLAISVATTHHVGEMYRLYNPNSGEHFYTGNPLERLNLINLGWNDEGVGWIAPVLSNTPVYRLYNQYGGEHHYTTSIAERDSLIAAGWTYESIGWYSDDARTVPLYRQYNPNAFANNHNYTTSLDENNWLVSLGWRAEDIGWYGVG